MAGPYYGMVTQGMSALKTRRGFGRLFQVPVGAPILAACGVRGESTKAPAALVSGEMAPEIEIYHQHSAAFMDGLLESY